MVAFQLHEHPLLPSFDLDGSQSVTRSIKIAYTAEIRRPFQFTFQRIGPAMIRTAQLVRMSFSLGHHRSGVMATHIKECAQPMIAAANGDDWFAGDFARHIIARLV